ncbi:MAG: 6-phosphofructokinase, partial [Bdellovibrionia bacterium]
VLTSGGDAPGMNAAIRAIVRYGISQGCKVHGIMKGYSGLLEEEMISLTASSVANIIQRGGTILKTDRCEDFYKKSFRKKAAEILRNNEIGGLVVIGGDGSFTGAHLMEKETGFPVIGVPGTIDNDIAGTDDTIGFDTAVNTAIDAIDRIRDTASSHDRIFLVEVMGHSSGFIGLQVAMGGGAETVLLPERKESIESICSTIERGIARGKTSSIIVVAEGPKPGLSARITADLEKRGYACRVCILGHTQRGGSPTAHDRVLASVLGASAVYNLVSGHSNAMVGIRTDRVVLVPFEKVIGKKKAVSPEMLSLAQVLSI